MCNQGWEPLIETVKTFSYLDNSIVFQTNKLAFVSSGSTTGTNLFTEVLLNNVYKWLLDGKTCSLLGRMLNHLPPC